MDAIVWEWVNFMLRWLHVITAIAWIGSSFYFVHLDASLRRVDGLPKGTSGEAWQIHGGGFYHMVKYNVAPANLPEELTWFKWEAYATWISGFFLLVVLYYRGAELFLIDQTVMELEQWQAIAISAVTLVLGWVVYDRLCKSPVGRNDTSLIVTGFVLLVLAAWGFSVVFSGRGAMLQVGALIGTMMAANVAHTIIPNQKKVVADLLAGRTPDPALGKEAKQRSMHNNYLTLPVLFLMVSNHYPLAFGTGHVPAIVAIVLVVGATIRHFFNSRHAGKPTPWWTWGVAVVGVAGIVWLSARGPNDDAVTTAANAAQPVDFAQVEEVILSRCGMCHAEVPAWPGLPTAPKGVRLETPEDIRRHAPEIRLQAVLSTAMPPGNISMITPEERGLLGAWSAGKVN
ncbi:cysteine desulfurase [Skermanella stibiiresistens SB22]|uniref:Cysteine desulfurase n=1 Tax=Skermanella stibiiresistens SB22 TaxID=1385369 RepID=W9H1K3_9PROT|nr:urate hydroxylase PuuD [Skermanella stibiiresistens]EWY38681.1 cysteine desulfurase [Skermanella stibiiresistens SB22]